MNRLQLATEKPSNPSSPVCPDSGSQWCELFGYDTYGNRSLTQSSFVGIQAPVNFSPASNRITDAGWGYDQAGNLNQDPVAVLSYKYDAENRVVAACANDGPATCTNQPGIGRTLYSYDGDGRRVGKQTPDGTLTTYIYDASGTLAAEYGGVVTTTGTAYLTADQLGSTRAVTDASGTAIAPMISHPLAMRSAPTHGQLVLGMEPMPRCGRNSPAKNATQKRASITSVRGTSLRHRGGLRHRTR